MDELDKEKIRRLRTWEGGGTTGPLKIDIELHRRCNLKCLSCSRRNDEKYGNINEFSETIEMPVGKWLSIVDEAAELDVREWHIAGGGEPLFLPQVTWPVMERIKRHGMYGILTTNGTLWSEERLRQLVEMGWDRIHFSVDGPDASTHDGLRGVKGAFEKTCRSIRSLARFREECGSDKPMLNMNSVLSVRNYEKLPEFVELAHDLGIEYMFVEPLIVYSETGRRLKLKRDHLRRFPAYLAEAKARAKEYGIFSNFAAFDTYADDSNLDEELIAKSSSMDVVVRRDAEAFLGKGALSWSCYDPWFHMSIKADGYVSHCDVATDSGDNIKEKTLSDVWFGPYFQGLRDHFMQQKTKDYCAQCNPSHTTQRRWLRKHMQQSKDSCSQGPKGAEPREGTSTWQRIAELFRVRRDG